MPCVRRRLRGRCLPRSLSENDKSPVSVPWRRRVSGGEHAEVADTSVRRTPSHRPPVHRAGHRVPSCHDSSRRRAVAVAQNDSNRSCAGYNRPNNLPLRSVLRCQSHSQEVDAYAQTHWLADDVCSWCTITNRPSNSRHLGSWRAGAKMQSPMLSRRNTYFTHYRVRLDCGALICRRAE